MFQFLFYCINLTVIPKYQNVKLNFKNHLAKIVYMDSDLIKTIRHIFNHILIIFGIFIITINFLIMYIIIAKFTERNAEMKLTLILCIIEYIQGIEFTIQAIIKLIVGYRWFESYSIQYILETTVEWPSVRLGLFTLSIISILRYLVVCHKIEKSFKF
jgi:hypothetical protein